VHTIVHHGTYLGLLAEPSGSEDTDIPVPSVVPLHLIHSFYDFFMEIQSSNCVIEHLESHDPHFNGDPLAEVIIPRRHFHSMIFKSNASLTLNSNVNQRKPTATFDYRTPCSLSIDISASILNNILDDWQAIIITQRLQ